MNETAGADISQSNEKLNPAYIKVEYDPFILSEKCPYKVNFAVDKAAQSLKTLGVDDEGIRKLRVKFINDDIISPDGRSTGGVYSVNTITISAGSLWRLLNRQFESLEELLSAKGADELPPEKVDLARSISRETISSEAQKLFDFTFIHESTHYAGDALEKAEAKQALRRFDFTGAARILMKRVSIFTPEGVAEEEARAGNMVSKVMKDERWKNIVEITSKQ